MTPAATAAVNAERLRMHGKPKRFPRPSSIAAADAPTQRAFRIVIKPFPGTSNAFTQRLYRTIHAAVYRPRSNTPSGRRNCLSALLSAFGGTCVARYAVTKPLSVEYMRYIKTSASSKDDASVRRLAPYTPPLKHCTGGSKTFWDPVSRSPFDLHVVVRYHHDAASTDGTATLNAIRETIAANPSLQELITLDAADDDDFIRLRFKLDEMDSVDALQQQLHNAGLSNDRCFILNAAMPVGCLAPSGSVRFRPIITIPRSLLPTATSALAMLSPEIFIQPPPFCSGCGIIGNHTHACRKCDVAKKSDKICFQCQRRRSQHAPTDFDPTNARCTTPNTDPCMLCNDEHEPYKCLSFNPHWEPLRGAQHVQLPPAAPAQPAAAGAAPSATQPPLSSSSSAPSWAARVGASAQQPQRSLAAISQPTPASATPPVDPTTAQYQREIAQLRGELTALRQSFAALLQLLGFNIDPTALTATPVSSSNAPTVAAAVAAATRSNPTPSHALSNPTPVPDPTGFEIQSSRKQKQKQKRQKRAERSSPAKKAASDRRTTGSKSITSGSKRPQSAGHSSSPPRVRPKGVMYAEERSDDERDFSDGFEDPPDSVLDEA